MKHDPSMTLHHRGLRGHGESTSTSSIPQPLPGWFHSLPFVASLHMRFPVLRVFASSREPTSPGSRPRQALPSASSASSAVSSFSRTLHSDHGGAAVSFIIAFPIFLWIIAILVQYILLVNAKILITHSAATAARAAVTALPEGNPDKITTAACMSLAPLSPVATTPIAPEATTIYEALQQVGVNVPGTFPARYTYALAATQVSYTPQDNYIPQFIWLPQDEFVHSRGRLIDVTVTYRFRLTVPGAMRLIGTHQTVAGVEGRFLDIPATCRVQTAHSRRAATDDSGLAQ